MFIHYQSGRSGFRVNRLEWFTICIVILIYKHLGTDVVAPQVEFWKEHSRPFWFSSLEFVTYKVDFEIVGEKYLSDTKINLQLS
jgi:hypothetical protein